MATKMTEAQMLKKAARTSDEVAGWTGGGKRGAAARRLFNLCLANAQAREVCRAAVRGQTRQ